MMPSLNLIVCIQGKQPNQGSGRVEITLSDASADVLAKVEGLQCWHVGPTMQRGSNHPDDLPKVKNQSQKKPTEAKPKEIPVKSEKEGSAEVKEKKSKKDAKKKVCVADLDLTADSFARNHAAAGENCKSMMLEILQLDANAFPKSPLFGPDGVCRMTFDGASSMTRDRVLEHVWPTVDCMQLDFNVNASQ